MSAPFVRTALATLIASTLAPLATADTTPAVVVTATRIATRTTDLLSDVSTLERADIERAGSARLADLLGTLPGVQFSSSGGPGATGFLSLRGANSTHTLILIDGQRVSSATAGTTAIEHLPLEQVERIEVLRGPAASLYGSDAIGGVIQIFTRRGEGAPAPTLFLGAGRYGTTVGAAGYGGRSGATSFHVQLGQERSAGYSDIKEARGGSYDMFNADRDGYDNRNLNANLTQRVSADLTVGADYLYSRGAKHFDSTSCSSSFPWPCTPDFDSRLVQTLDSGSAHADYRISPLWQTALRVGQSRDRMTNWQFDPVGSIVSQPQYDTRQDQVAWQNDFTLPVGKLLAALEWRKVHVDSTQTLIANDQTTRAAVLGYQGWFGNHSLQASARHDDISGLGGHATGSFAYGYRVAAHWTARAAIGTAYHAPTFNDLYWPLDLVSFYQGNPALKPEQARSRELGLAYDGDGVSAGATLYHNKVGNLIDYVPGTAPTYIGTMGNVGQATIKGASFQYARKLGAWDAKAAYDVLAARDDSTGNTLQRRAPRTGSVELRRNFDRYDLGVQWKGIASRFNDRANSQTLGGYGLVSVDAGYRIDKDWSVQAKLANLFDKDYVAVRSTLTPYNDYAVAGRSLFVGLRYTPQ
jgi:vitamin B12 transporter